MSRVAERLAALRDRIAVAARRAGRDAARVRIVAVAKTARRAGLLAAWEAGQREFAHNRVQWLERDRAVLPLARWHVVGPLQSNKVRRAVRSADVVQTVGDARVAQALARSASDLGRAPLEVFVQVNLTPQDGRYGCTAEALAGLLRAVAQRTELRCAGLMTVGPLGAEEKTLRAHFARLRDLALGFARESLLPPDPELSMGMTEDYELAVEEGATLVRIGRGIFPATEDS